MRVPPPVGQGPQPLATAPEALLARRNAQVSCQVPGMPARSRRHPPEVSGPAGPRGMARAVRRGRPRSHRGLSRLNAGLRACRSGRAPEGAVLVTSGCPWAAPLSTLFSRFELGQTSVIPNVPHVHTTYYLVFSLNPRPTSPNTFFRESLYHCFKWEINITCHK